MRIDKDLTAASVIPLVLGLLVQEESYGYQIIKRVREQSGGEWHWSEGMLYPVLHRLEQRGLIAARWKAAESGRKRRYYAITKRGQAELDRLMQQWQVVQRTLLHVGLKEQKGFNEHAEPNEEQELKERQEEDTE